MLDRLTGRTGERTIGVGASMMAWILLCIAVAAQSDLEQSVATGAAADVQARRAEVWALSADIALLEELNRLQLTPQQVDGLIDLAKKRRAVTKTFDAKRRQLLDALASLLRQKRTLLLRDQPVPEELEEKVAQLNAELTAIDHAERERALPLVDEVRKVLSRSQLSIILGQFEALESAMEMLQGLRSLPQQEYEDEADAVAEELEAPDQGLTAEKIRGIFDLARRLSDDDFARQRQSLARQLLPAYMPSMAAQAQMILDLLANPRLLPLLEDRKASAAGR